MSDPVAYAQQLKAIFPRGNAWPEAGGTVWQQLLRGMAVEPSRIEVRAVDLIDESDPRTMIETLENWEEMLGLPDPCLGLDQDEETRRSMIIATLFMRGGASPQYFEALGALFNRPCTVSEEFAFVAGLSACGDGLADEVEHFQAGADCGSFLSDVAAPFYWWIKSEASWATAFAAGESGAGDALLDFGDDRIECVIRRFMPVHTRVHHEYDAINAVAALESAQ